MLGVRLPPDRPRVHETGNQGDKAMTDLSAHPTQIASAWLADFQSALERRDIDAAIALFEPDCYWRDLVAFTWNIRTQEGPEAIRTMLKARLAETRPTAFAVEGRAKGAEHGVHPGRKTWLEQRQQEEATLGLTEQPYVVIVGGGQGGIAL